MRTSFLTIIFLTSMSYTFAQGKDWEIVSGFGFPDVLHVGLNMEMSHKNSLGINAGFIPSESKAAQFTVEHKLNFGYSKKITNRPTWYFGERLTYFYEDNNTKIWRTFYLTPAIGRHLNITNKFGLNVDFGTFIRLWEKENECSGECDENRDVFHYISPTARLQIFYKL